MFLSRDYHTLATKVSVTGSHKPEGPENVETFYCKVKLTFDTKGKNRSLGYISSSSGEESTPIIKKKGTQLVYIPYKQYMVR